MMPAEEFLTWQEFFRIYPFTQDREDFRMAQLCAVITNMSGRTIRSRVNLDNFLPKFLEERAVTFRPKSLEQQRAEFTAFKAKLQSLKDSVKRKPL